MLSLRARLTVGSLILAHCTAAVTLRAQARLVGEVFAAGGTNTMSAAARSVYERAGGLTSSVGLGFGIGVEVERFRVIGFYLGLPNELVGPIQSFTAARQLGGVRVDGLFKLARPRWSFVPSLAITGGSRPRVPVTLQDDDRLAPSQLSDIGISWRAVSARATAGLERDFGSRYAARLSGGAEFTAAEGGQWTQFTNRKPGVGIGALAELGFRIKVGRVTK